MHHALLEQRAHPPSPNSLAQVDSADGGRVPGDDGQAEIRAEGLGDRVHERPALSTPRERGGRHSGHRAGVVVLDHKDIRVALEHRTQGRRALRANISVTADDKQIKVVERLCEFIKIKRRGIHHDKVVMLARLL